MATLPDHSGARAALTYYALVAIALGAAVIGAAGVQWGIGARETAAAALGGVLAGAGAVLAARAPAWYWRAPRRRGWRGVAAAATDTVLAVGALLAAAGAARAGGVLPPALAAATITTGIAAAFALIALAIAGGPPARTGLPNPGFDFGQKIVDMQPSPPAYSSDGPAVTAGPRCPVGPAVTAGPRCPTAANPFAPCVLQVESPEDDFDMIIRGNSALAVAVRELTAGDPYAGGPDRMWGSGSDPAFSSDEAKRGATQFARARRDWLAVTRSPPVEPVADLREAAELAACYAARGDFTCG